LLQLYLATVDVSNYIKIKKFSNIPTFARKYHSVIPQSICYIPPLILDFVSSSDLFIKEESCKQFATFRGVHDVFDYYLFIFYYYLFFVVNIG